MTRDIVVPILAAVIAGVLGIVGTLLARRKKRPKRINPHVLGDLVLIINGATGVGKSEIAYALARRYSFYRNVGGDLIREVCRVLHAPLGPEIIVSESSFLVGRAVSEHAAPVSVAEGVMKQSETLWPVMKAVISRTRERRIAAIFEGVNFLASLVFGDNGFHPHPGTRILFVTLFIKDEATHLNRIWTRGFGGLSREAGEAKYVKNIDLIREANEFFRLDTERAAAQWPKARIIAIENSGSIESTVNRIDDEIKGLIKGLAAS
ncbi:MAG TPA: hypothetical protein VKA60_03045 [Blastocatellia bacterium]|nr:hypothetical protein [Blastocatellia bacterium]